MNTMKIAAPILLAAAAVAVPPVAASAAQPDSATEAQAPAIWASNTHVTIKNDTSAPIDVWDRNLGNNATLQPGQSKKYEGDKFARFDDQVELNVRSQSGEFLEIDSNNNAVGLPTTSVWAPGKHWERAGFIQQENAYMCQGRAWVKRHDDYPRTTKQFEVHVKYF